MKKFKCKKCGSDDIAITLPMEAVDPNSETTIKDFLISLINEDRIESDEGYCNKCNDYCQLSLEDIDISGYDEQQLFHLWQDAKIDMYLVTIQYFRKSDNQSLGGENESVFKVEQGKQYIEDYIKKCDVKPNPETYHKFEIRLLDIPAHKRDNYSEAIDIIDTYMWENIKPLYTKEI